MKRTVVHQKMPAVLHTVPFLQVPVTHRQEIAGAASKPNCPVKGNRMRQEMKKAAATCPHWPPDALRPQAFGGSTWGSRLLHTGSWFPPGPKKVPRSFPTQEKVL